jgi:hypothetical protein
MPKAKPTPWDVKLSADRRDELAQWLSRELDNALSVRTASDAEVSYWHVLYEQGRTRSAQNAPWADAADLTSAIGTEKVDALRSRIVKTIFPRSGTVFTVEGWGEAATKAPFVEEYHQWQLEAEGFQAAFSKAAHLSLIEPRGVLEVYEETGRRPVRKTIKAALQLAPDGTALIGEDLKPVFQQNPDGTYVEAIDDPSMPMPMPSADVVIDDYEPIARGPRHRTIPYRDYLQLPGHAREKSEVWGHAKRFWKRVDQLKERVKEGVYDKAAVEALGTADERLHASYTNAGGTTLAGQALEIPTQEDGLAEKELWEVLFLYELDKTGYRWFVATLHKESQQLLRLQYDDIGRPRFFPLVPFPRPNSLEGYSFIGHKLITTIEENTAWRNMLADRAALQLQAPIKRQQNALWDPDEEPIGPKAVITVRDMNEVQAMELPDYTAPARERIIDTERQAEKLGGMTDIASGSKPSEDRTLGETRLVTAFSEVRIEEVIRNIDETLEEIAQVRHLMHKRQLSEMPDGLEAPSRVLQGLETRGVDVSAYMPNKKFAASILEGAFRFKPSGSVEATDKHQQRADFAESIKALATMSTAIPMIGMVMQQPPAAKALLERWAHLYEVPDKQAFLGAQALGMAMQQFQMMQMGVGPGGPAGSGASPSVPGSAGPPPANNPPSGPINPGAQLPQERVGIQ